MKVKDQSISNAALHILLALAESDLHGYGILLAVKRQSEGKFKLGPGTLYANLDRLLAAGLVGEAERQTKDGEKRREYHLTSGGEKALRAEIRRLQQIVATARDLGQLGDRLDKSAG
jgi:DNA-binding PadR family transcriptional regulator